ncbi:MobQ family relaxase [Listeria seeligeri]|uniref:MobQ family relaxase n=1 Tax=Listeria seeligeri TaxID=1640 RepID=UPI0016236FAC|nr:MobQ family relaxase [Listeria seeligeri]MBC1556997.1 MobA/MobL family protein [Listeria seeligeri]HAB0718282.1 hypothetical protein [Listeria monocytogenes]
MAIYSLSMKIGSRSSGQNAVAASAYRSGDKLLEENENDYKFYERDVKPDGIILAPDNAPNWVYNREKLWNEVEKSEKRYDAQLWRELQIALPRELDYQSQKDLITSYIQDTCISQGMIADINIHRDNSKNPHAHVMLTTRDVSEIGFGKKNRDWNKKEFLVTARKLWADRTNEILKQHNVIDLIDHRSHSDRGLKTIPTKHLGYKANELEKMGIRTEIGDFNRQVKSYNEKIISLQAKRNELAKKNFAANKEKIHGAGNAVIPNSSYHIHEKKFMLAKRALWRAKKEKYFPEQINTLTKAQKQFDELKHLDALYRQSALNFLESKNPELQKYALNIKDKSKQSEVIIRLANKVKELNTSDFMTIIKAYETEALFEDAKKLVNGDITYNRVIQSKHNIMKSLNNNPNESKKKWGRSSISTLVKISDFLEGRAIVELQKAGYSSLMKKYVSHGLKAEVISLYDSYVLLGNVSAETLERYMLDEKVITRTRNLVREKLTAQNIDKKIKHMDNWRYSLERQLSSASNSDREELEEKHSVAIENKATLLNAKEILNNRVLERLEQLPEMKKVQDILLHSIPENDLKNAYISLHDERLTTNNAPELFAKSLITEKESSIEREAKTVFSKNELNIHSLKEVIQELETNTAQVDVNQLKNEIKNISSVKENLNHMWQERERLENKRILFKTDRNELNAIRDYFSQNKIEAKTLSGAMKNLNYRYICSQNDYLKYKMDTEVRIPIAKSYIAVQENKAFRYFEQHHNAAGLVANASKLSAADRQALLNGYGAVKHSPLEEHAAIFEKPYLREVTKAAERASIVLKITNTSNNSNNIIKQAQSFDKVISAKQKIQGEVAKLRTESQQNYISFDRIANKQRHQEKEIFKEKSKQQSKNKKQQSKSAKGLSAISKALSSNEQINESEKKREEKKRMQSINKTKDKEQELTLERER